MRQPTAEQKAKAAERREKFRAIAKQVSEMTDEQRAAEGRALSLHNTLMSMVAGRAVKKGEHGAMMDGTLEIRTKPQTNEQLTVNQIGL